MDLFDGMVRLDPGTTKNDEARNVPLVDELLRLLRALPRRLDADLVFTRGGAPITSFRKSWNRACVSVGRGTMFCRTCAKPVAERCEECKEAKRPQRLKYRGLIFHDLRRTGIRNLVRAGVPERVAMAISGHKTRSVFERYNIVSGRDLEDAKTKLEAFRRAQEALMRAKAAPPTPNLWPAVKPAS